MEVFGLTSKFLKRKCREKRRSFSSHTPPGFPLARLQSGCCKARNGLAKSVNDRKLLMWKDHQKNCWISKFFWREKIQVFILEGDYETWTNLQDFNYESSGSGSNTFLKRSFATQFLMMSLTGGQSNQLQATGRIWFCWKMENCCRDDLNDSCGHS